MDEWEAAEEQALERIATRLADVGGQSAPEGLHAAAAGAREAMRRGVWPLDWVARGAGWGTNPPADDVELVVGLVAALVAPEEPTGLDEAEEAALLLVQPADWAAVVERALDASVASQPAGAAELTEAVAADAEADGEPLSAGERAAVGAGLELVVGVLVAAGLLDTEERVTPVGGWALPRGVVRGLGGDLDGGS